MNEIDIFGEIGWDVTAGEIKEQLSKMNGDITVNINSGGGSVFEGITIFNLIASYSKGEVTTVVVGLAASMASYIALAGDKTKAYDSAVYMIHNARTIAFGDQIEMRKTADIIEGLSNLLLKKYVSVTGTSTQTVQGMMNDETFFYGAEMQEHGFIGEIISTEEETDKKVAYSVAAENIKAINNSLYKHIDTEKELAVAFMKDNKLESQTKPTQKKEVEVDEKEVEALSSKIRAIKARLKLKSKGL